MAGAAEPLWPEDAIEVGSILDAWGIKGWIRVQPYAADPQALLASRRWFLKPPAGAPVLRPGTAAWPVMLSVLQARGHGDAIVAQVQDVPDRTAAESLRGARIHIPRSSFPAADADEFYWVDLIGLAVCNRQGEALGTVVGLLDTGPHSVLRVAAQATAAGTVESGAERLIPFVAAYVDSVSLAEHRIVVDWGLDY